MNDPWRERVEYEIERARELGKTPRAAPATEAEWAALREKCPSSLLASWYALTGRLHTPRRAT